MTFKNIVVGVVWSALISASLVCASDPKLTVQKQEQVKPFLTEEMQKKIGLNAAALAMGIFCGAVFKWMWEDTGHGHDLSKIYASLILAATPMVLARELETNPFYAETAMVTAGVLMLARDNE